MNPHDFLVQFALGYLGVVEATGHNDGPFVEMFQQAVDGIADGAPWCAAFVQFCVQQVEQQFGVVSPLFRTEHVLTMWNGSQGMIVWPPYPGCIVCWQKTGTTNGHTGIVTSVDAISQTFGTIEGNTSGGPGFEREGNGVFEKVRLMGGEGDFVLLGFLDPFPIGIV